MIGYNIFPNLSQLVSTLVESGVQVAFSRVKIFLLIKCQGMLKLCKVTLGTPVKPMLAKICHGFEG